jgi:hypothetical protein
MDLGPVSPFQATDRSMAGALMRPRSVGAAASRRALLLAALAAALIALAVALAPAGRAPAGPAPARSFGHAQALTRSTAAGLPLAAQAQISGELAAGMAAFRARPTDSGFQTENRARGLTARFDRSGVQIAAASATVGISVEAIGYRDARLPVGESSPTARRNRVSYTRARLSEWYRNGPMGIEQGFTIPHALPMAQSGPLTLTMELSGDARPTLSHDARSVVLRDGSTLLSYGALVATDAAGHTLPSWLGLGDGKLLLHVDAAGARYPLTIDPLIQKGAKLTGGEAEARFGASAALSGDGSTLLVGAPEANASRGAVWVFARSGSEWKQQGETPLTAPSVSEEGTADECAEESIEEAGECAFGSSVALSADGNTALIGAPSPTTTAGTAWVFTRSGAEWTRGPALSGDRESNEGRFGKSVALSADGALALVGVPSAAAGHGRVWTFTRSGSTWTRESALQGSETTWAHFGRSVALSGDGGTALIGGPGDSNFNGAAWTFSRSGDSWIQQGGKLTGGDEASERSHFGKVVTLSADASTALISAQNDDEQRGSVWTFVSSASGFSQLGAKLSSPEGGEGHFGASLALSGDGATALIGAPRAETGLGLVGLFTRSGSGWSEKPALGGSEAVGKGWSGASVALSSDGEVAAIGAPRDQKKAGGAWVFSTEALSAILPPTVANVAPGRGPTQGGTEVTITGSNFTRDEQHEPVVMFGSRPAASFKVRTAAEIRAVSPPSPAGRVDVTVTTATGTSPISAADSFRFEGGGPSDLQLPSTTTSPGTAASAVGGALGVKQAAGAACRVTLRGKRIVVARTSAAVRLLRTGTGQCRGTVTLRYKQKAAGRRFKLKSIGSARFSIVPGRSQVVKIKLNKLGRRLFLAGHGKLNASLAVLRTSPGPKLAKTASVRLSVKKPRSPSKIAH